MRGREPSVPGVTVGVLVSRVALERVRRLRLPAPLVVGVAVLAGCGGHVAPGHPAAASRSRVVPQAGAIVGTLPFPARESELFALRARSLFVLVVRPGRAASITVERVDPDRSVTRKRVPFALPNYLMDV